MLHYFVGFEMHHNQSLVHTVYVRQFPAAAAGATQNAACQGFLDDGVTAPAGCI
jgi:hypothetical protein